MSATQTAPVSAAPDALNRLMPPDEAAVHLADDFRRIACRLWPSRVRSVREDLVQEMTLAVLSVGAPLSARKFRSIALWHAINYLHREERHERLELKPHADLCKMSDSRQRVTLHG